MFLVIRQVQRTLNNFTFERLYSQGKSIYPTMADSIVKMEAQSSDDNGTIIPAASTSPATVPLNDSSDGPVVEQDLDPYAYTKSEAFTSEIFKVEVNNFPRFFGIKQLKKKLAQIHVVPCKVKMIERSGYAFINFSCEEEREKALIAINGQIWKNRKIHAKKANPAADPMVLKRKKQAEAARDGPASKVPRKEDNRTLEEQLKDAVTPLWRYSYDDQLTKKVEEIHVFLKNLGRVMENENPNLKHWFSVQRKINKGLSCNLLPFVKSPVLEFYRNKCEFNIGQSVDGIDKTIGFRLGAYKEGHVCVASPGYCNNVPRPMVEVAKLVEYYCQSRSDLPGYHPEQKTGNWRQVVVRTTLKGDIMVIVLLHKEGLPQAKIDEERHNLKEFFLSKKVTSVFQNISLYLELKGDDRKSETELYHLSGDTHIYEPLLDLRFRISPTAFFQVNTPAAEILYTTVADLANVSEKTVLLDVCCGTGTIGLTMAKRVKKVIGIEMCKEAVEDAKHNAELNGIKNIEFHCGKAEDVLPKLIGMYRSEDVVAIVDPPRGGLHTDVVLALRNNLFVRRLVYLSCSPKGAKNNIMDLTRKVSRRLKCTEFCMMDAIPVDLFPQTFHFELVMLFERYNNQELGQNFIFDSNNKIENEPLKSEKKENPVVDNSPVEQSDSVSTGDETVKKEVV